MFWVLLGVLVMLIMTHLTLSAILAEVRELNHRSKKLIGLVEDGVDE